MSQRPRRTMSRGNAALAWLAITLLTVIAPNTATSSQSLGTVEGTTVALAGPCGAAAKIGPRCVVPPHATADVDLIFSPTDHAHPDIYVRTDADGAFMVSLIAGTYDVRLARASSPWRIEPLSFSITAGEILFLTIRVRLLRA